MYRFIFVLCAGVMSLSACNVNEPPAASLIDEVPVIELGTETAPEGEYILHVPADKTVPVSVSVNGSFLAKSASVSAEIQVQQDLYIYKQWSSFDGRQWQPSHGLFDTRMRAGLTPEGAVVNVRFNRADQQQ